MKKIILLAFVCFLTVTEIFSQFTTDEIAYGRRIDFDKINTWAIGAGVNNFIMHGDLRSIGTSDDTNYWNFGGHFALSKMFNPLLGLEGKLSYNQLSGGAQYFNRNISNHTPAYVGLASINDLDNLIFEGESYSAELNLILSFTNLYTQMAQKWHLAGYFGVGYQIYNSRLGEKNRGASGNETIFFPSADFGNNPARNSENFATSIYVSAQLGIKRKLSKRIDLEFRTGMYLNNEDHLDATISRKQDLETFFVSSLGVIVKLGKNKIFSIWNEEDDNQLKMPDAFKIEDTDGDGVMDRLDVSPDTPAGVMVYGNGKPVDSDKDGLPDYKDKCPLKYGLISNEGCPEVVDTDGDGIMDSDDLCPNVAGVEANRGCPEGNVPNQTSGAAGYQPNNINNQIALLATSIYFDTNSDKIKQVSYATIDEIVKLMKEMPNVRYEIEGHTDNRNSEKYNLYLSQRRANAVRKYMIKKGIPSSNLDSRGYGETRPRYSNFNAGGRQLNRRVEIKPVGGLE